MTSIDKPRLPGTVHAEAGPPTAKSFNVERMILRTILYLGLALAMRGMFGEKSDHSESAAIVVFVCAAGLACSTKR